MQQHVSLSSYNFKRSKFDGIIEVLNEASYVMAEYSERTGVVKWQRVVAVTQRQQIETWLGVHYPIQAEGQIEARRRVKAHSAAAAAAAASAAPAKPTEIPAAPRRAETKRTRRTG